ncbi:MAG TPA: methyltransferase domain-containing protein, partial [Gammaproteobacteria bacterium]|nr:methyltransferase domain-containing protein [Gammaproteobacteria bacterium]
DPSRALLEQAKNIAGINTVVSNAVDYVNNNSAQTFDGIILKEMIHHISDKNLEAFFAKLLHLLKPHGTCVICTRPQRGIEYPFFADAIKKWPESQPDPAIYVSLLRKAGFKNIDIAHVTYKMQISLDEWVRFIKNRLWSNFSHAQFSDAALNKGIEEILHKYGKTNTIEFNEKQIFIQARKR